MKNSSSLTMRLNHFKQNGFLVVLFALLLEALFIGYLAFAALFTIETILPTFITAHVSLTKFFSTLLLFTFILIFISDFLELTFSWNLRMNKKNPILWIGFLWTIGILTLSLLNFPSPLILVIVITFLFVGYFFWKILLDEER